eukprot:2500489-Alexandrium_andersonii.AAC.1
MVLDADVGVIDNDVLIADEVQVELVRLRAVADHVIEDVGTTLGTEGLAQVSQANPQGAMDPEGRRV